MQGAVATVHADDRRLVLCHLPRFRSQRVGTGRGQDVTRLTQDTGETSRTVRISAIGSRFPVDEDHDGHAHKTLHPEQPAAITAGALRPQSGDKRSEGESRSGRTGLSMIKPRTQSER